MDINNIILGPVVTEKDYEAQAKGKYMFRVHADATKIDVKNALQRYYGVKADTVNMVTVRSKERAVGRHFVQKRQAYRKAIVRLPKGVTIDFTKLSSKSKK